MAITITPHPEGATIAIRAQPKAKKNAILGEHGCALKIAVTAPPEDGRANEAILDFLRRRYHFQRTQLELLGGHTSRNKVVLVRGVTQEQLIALIEGESVI
jgi:uncharacterized protein (TIGR00251 family)